MKNSQTILLVEDDRALIEMYEAAFELEGYNILKAENGKEGLEVLKKETPDIILLDILMPGMNGFGFLKEIKKDAQLRDVPVLLLTNLGESKIDMNRELAFALGIEGYLIKVKNTPDQVLERVRAVLKKRKEKEKRS